MFILLFDKICQPNLIFINRIISAGLCLQLYNCIFEELFCKYSLLIYQVFCMICVDKHKINFPQLIEIFFRKIKFLCNPYIVQRYLGKLFPFDRFLYWLNFRDCNLLFIILFDTLWFLMCLLWCSISLINNFIKFLFRFDKFEWFIRLNLFIFLTTHIFGLEL